MSSSMTLTDQNKCFRPVYLLMPVILCSQYLDHFFMAYIDNCQDYYIWKFPRYLLQFPNLSKTRKELK